MSNDKTVPTLTLKYIVTHRQTNVKRQDSTNPYLKVHSNTQTDKCQMKRQYQPLPYSI